MQNKQEFFDAVKEAFEQNKLPCVNSRGICVYKHKDKACLIGMCIDDELYNKVQPDTYQYSAVQMFYEMGIRLFPEWMTLRQAVRLQQLHDDLANPHLNIRSSFLLSVRKILGI